MRPAEPRARGRGDTKSGRSPGKRSARRTARGPFDPRLTLAVAHGNVATVNLHGVAPIEPADALATTAEHRIGPEDPVQPPPAPGPSPIQADSMALDQRVVKEITQRKTLFRMCYVSAQRRGVVATRADVRWVLQADGSVRDVAVEVAQDAQLADCIRVVASRPFPSGVGQEIPVAIPLLFVISR